jgi:ActR/RegA family two-component response regulator
VNSIAAKGEKSGPNFLSAVDFRRITALPAHKIGGFAMVPVREQKTYSILLADDLTLVGGLAVLCQGQPSHRVVGQCSEGAAALRLIQAHRPDIAVLDLNLSPLHTLELVRRVREASLSTRIVVLSMRRDRKTVVEALRCGR